MYSVYVINKTKTLFVKSLVQIMLYGLDSWILVRYQVNNILTREKNVWWRAARNSKGRGGEQSFGEVQQLLHVPVSTVSHRNRTSWEVIDGEAQQILKCRSALGNNDHPIKTYLPTNLRGWVGKKTQIIHRNMNSEYRNYSLWISP